MPRADETQYRLVMWTGDSGAGERLAAQVLLASGFEDPDPSHPYGGPDGGRDAIFTRNGEVWLMAVYFPHGEKTTSEVAAKFASDVESAKKHRPKGVAFVTNQEITLGERKKLVEMVSGIDVEIFHMEKVAAILDQPSMAGIRQQFLGMDPGSVPLNLRLAIRAYGYLAVDGDELREGLLEVEDSEDRLAAQSQSRLGEIPAEERPLFLTMPALFQYEPPSPPSPEEAEAMINERRVRVNSEWSRIEEYIIGTNCPAMYFTVTNMAESFLYDVRIVIAFGGAYGTKKLRTDTFEHEKLLDPDYERPRSMYESPVYNFKPKGYPVEWKNRDSGLEVRITLSELPPGEAFEWDSEGCEDVVLVARSASSIRVTWQAVAQTYGTAFFGPAIDIPVEKLPLIEAVASLAGQVDH